jgi:hypothetical protein
MKLLDSLNWYRQDRFTAQDATRSTRITEPSQRLMQAQRIFTPVQQGTRTSKRMLGASAIKRMAAAKELSDCGLSLTVAGKIIYAATMIEDGLFAEIDPIAVMYAGRQIDPNDDLPPLRNDTDPNGWFDPKMPVQVDDIDQWVELLDRRYVRVAGSKTKTASILGEVSHDGSDFTVWYGSDFAKWFGDGFDRLFDDQGVWVIRDADSPDYKPKRPAKTDFRAAEHVWQHPTSKVSVNIGMALRSALRRLLFIDDVI